MMNQQYVFHTKVHRDWVDHNGHLNDAMYNRIFSDTTDDWLGHLLSLIHISEPTRRS